jgi:hypothetical protein
MDTATVNVRKVDCCSCEAKSWKGEDAVKQIIYVAGMNRKHLAEQASSVPFWLLSATLLRKYPPRLEQSKRAEAFLNTDEGRKWFMENRIL